MICEQLESAEMDTLNYQDAESALRYLKKNFANLLLLDLTLGGMDGFELMQAMHTCGVSTPVMCVSGHDSELDILRAFEIGAEDYVQKPFSFSVLIARVRAVLKRVEYARDWSLTHNTQIQEDAFNFAGATVLPKTMEVRFPDGAAKSIGRKEIGIMKCFASNPDFLMTRENIIHCVWGQHADVRSRSVDQYLGKIRELFQRKKINLKCLRTIHGVGYVYEPVED